MKKKFVKKTTATLDKLGNHHLFELLGWNPQAIILIALLWNSNVKLTLGDLYEMIHNNNPKLKQQTDDLNLSDRMNAALQITTKVQIDELHKWDLPLYKLTQMLSFLPTMNDKEDVQNIWNYYLEKNLEMKKTDNKLDPMLKKLRERGLI